MYTLNFSIKGRHQEALHKFRLEDLVIYIFVVAIELLFTFCVQNQVDAYMYVLHYVDVKENLNMIMHQ